MNKLVKDMTHEEKEIEQKDFHLKILEVLEKIESNLRK